MGTMAYIKHPPDPVFDLANLPDAELELARGALLIAQSEYPELDIAAYLHQLDTMADAIRQKVQETTFPEHHIAELNRYLFEAQGFQGNNRDYYALSNNLLNVVLDRKTGVPITLAVVYIEVGRRAGLPLVGVNFPSHFLVKYKREHLDVFIDAFDNGKFMSEAALEAKLQETFGHPQACQTLLRPSMLTEATNKEILARILRNLMHAYSRLGRDDEALQAAQRITWFLPNATGDLRRLGYMLYRKSAYSDAISVFERCLQIEENPVEVAAIERNIKVLRQLLARLN